MARLRVRGGASSRPSFVTFALLLAFAFTEIVASSAFSALKSAQSNPVLPVVVDGKRVNLVLTTDVDGILLCEDRSVTLSPSSNKIDYDYARKLLRYQLSDMTQLSAIVDFSIPSLGVEAQRVSVGVFFVAQQQLSPTSLAYYLHHSDADGFIGVGFAFRVSSSTFWSLLPSLQYRVAMGNASHSAHHTGDVEAGDEDDDDDDDDEDEGHKKEEGDQADGRAVAMATATLNASDFIAGQDESEQTEWDWSEPSASVDQADDASRANNQGLVIPVHDIHFQCTQPSSDTSSSPDGGSTFALHDVDMFGDFTSSWDAAVDFNAPCLVLPQQFYNSLAGWTGLIYNEDEKISELAADTLLPSLSFALTYQGPVHVLDLNRLVLTTADGIKAVCIQRSSSIVHNGASVFSPIDTELTAQRYRLHGTMILPVYNMQQTPIVFGVMVLQALGDTIVDGDAKQLAFPHHDMGRKSSAVPLCMPAPECIGQQEFSPRLNTCLDPGCESYYFQSLDPDTKVCVISSGWLTFLYTTLAMFVAAEFVLSSQITRTVRTAVTIAADS